MPRSESFFSYFRRKQKGKHRMDVPRILEKPTGENGSTEVTLIVELGLCANGLLARPPFSEPKEAPSLLSPPVTLYEHNTTSEAKKLVFVDAATRFANGHTRSSGTGFGMADYSVEEPKKKK